jgi:glycosyltransferase involved in cell wall biosynthesis
MNSIALIRIPSTSEERDPSAKDIENLVSVSKEFFDNIITFEQRFTSSSTESINLTRHVSDSFLLNLFLLFIYQMQMSYALYTRRDNIEMVFLHAGGFLFVLPIITCKLLRIQIVVSVIGESHKGYENVSSDRIVGDLLTYAILVAERFAYFTADRIAVFSRDMMSYTPLLGYQSKCTQVRFNFETIPDEVPSQSERKTSVIYLGRICELKGADRATEAIKHLSSNTHIDVTASFVGDGAIVDRLQDQHNDLISFPGWVSQESVEEHLRDSRILLLPSRSEGLPKVILEAMAVGVVPVVTPVGDIPSVIEDGENGVLVDDPSAERIADILHQLLVSEDLSTLSHNARETIRSEYSFQTATDDFEELLQRNE